MIACAAISARALVEAAAADSVATVALDLFGDVDTCRWAGEWQSIGDPARLHIERQPLLAALEALARRAEVRGWVAGSGFEGRADLLEEAAARLPLLGTPAAAMRRLRDPRDFFACLSGLGIAHPEVRFEPPAAPAGWLVKDFASCGGWGLRLAGHAPADRGPGRHWQRQADGVPMSATFVANGRDAALLGFNQQAITAIGEHPCVFCGVIGPLQLQERVRQAMATAVRALTAEYGIHGLASLDFLLDGDQPLVLELNPRPPASAALYRELGAGGSFRAHLRACLQGELPQALWPQSQVRGQAIVFAPRALQLDPRGAALIAGWPGACDLPRAGARFAAGDPLCSLQASGATPALVSAELARRSDTLRQLLETLT